MTLFLERFITEKKTNPGNYLLKYSMTYLTRTFSKNGFGANFCQYVIS